MDTGKFKKTSWKASYEQTGREKYECYGKKYLSAMSTGNRSCLSSYVFYWSGFKQETTHTWFCMFDSTGLQEFFPDELSEWRLMKERTLSTFVEVPLEWGVENQRSECHPWSSSPNYIYFRTVCGIRPLVPGHREIEISPTFGKLKKIDAVYPHHLGNIIINLKSEGDSLSGEITVPEGINASLNWSWRILHNTALLFREVNISFI